MYTYQMDEDISEFQLVDTSKPQKVSTYKNKQKIQVYINSAISLAMDVHGLFSDLIPIKNICKWFVD